MRYVKIGGFSGGELPLPKMAPGRTTGKETGDDYLMRDMYGEWLPYTLGQLKSLLSQGSTSSVMDPAQARPVPRMVDTTKP